VTFTDLDLHPAILESVVHQGYDKPSPIQEALIPILMQGRDAIGQARTGTGKTAAFALPMLHRMAQNDDRGFIQALVLAPTRELATQVSAAIYTYGKQIGVRTLPITGGQPYPKQIKRLRQGVDVVVATPGRLVDLLNQGAVDLSHTHTVVLDEADEMFSMGFADDLDAIFDHLPAERQTALLSATMAPGVKKLAQKRLNNPEVISVTDGDRTASDVEQKGYLVYHRDKLAALVRLIETENVTSALAFVKTRAGAAEVASLLSDMGYAAEEISGELSQAARTAVLARFKKQQVKILVATDVAARGLDIDHVSHVFNVDLPFDPEAYVHRVGRTGRAGRDGTAMSLITPSDRGLLSRIERAAGRKIEIEQLPSVEQVETARATRLAEDIDAAFAGATDIDRRLVTEMIAAGADPMDVATAAIALARKSRVAAELPPVQVPKSKKGRSNSDRFDRNDRPDRSNRRDFDRNDRSNSGRGSKTYEKGGRDFNKPDSRDKDAGFVRLVVDAGHDIGIRPGQIVGAIANEADIPGRALGKIMIQDNRTFVDVPENMVGKVMAAAPFQFGRNAVQVEQA
jgi:ATP-dependent RNA helicase DeaD